MRLLRIFTTFSQDGLKGCKNSKNIRKCGWVEVPLPIEYERYSNDEIMNDADIHMNLWLGYIEGDLQIFLLGEIEIVERDVDKIYNTSKNSEISFLTKETINYCNNKAR